MGGRFQHECKMRWWSRSSRSWRLRQWISLWFMQQLGLSRWRQVLLCSKLRLRIRQCIFLQWCSNMWLLSKVIQTHWPSLLKIKFKCKTKLFFQFFLRFFVKKVQSKMNVLEVNFSILRIFQNTFYTKSSFRKLLFWCTLRSWFWQWFKPKVGNLSADE